MMQVCTLRHRVLATELSAHPALLQTDLVQSELCLLGSNVLQ